MYHHIESNHKKEVKSRGLMQVARDLEQHNAYGPRVLPRWAVADSFENLKNIDMELDAACRAELRSWARSVLFSLGIVISPDQTVPFGEMAEWEDILSTVR